MSPNKTAWGIFQRRQKFRIHNNTLVSGIFIRCVEMDLENHIIRNRDGHLTPVMCKEPENDILKNYIHTLFQVKILLLWFLVVQGNKSDPHVYICSPHDRSISSTLRSGVFVHPSLHIQSFENTCSKMIFYCKYLILNGKYDHW